MAIMLLISWLAIYFLIKTNTKAQEDISFKEGVVSGLVKMIEKSDSTITSKQLSIDSLNKSINNTQKSIPVINSKYEKSKNALTILNANADSAISYLSRRLSEKDSN